MPILIVCSSCAARLRVGDHLLGKRIKCASCGKPTVAEPPKPADEPETGVVQLKPLPSVPTEEPRQKTKPPPLPEEKTYDAVEEDEPPDDDRPRKKKKKRKAKRKRAFSVDSKTLVLFGGGGIVAIEFFLLIGAVVAPHDTLRFFMAYFFAMLPISTIIFACSVCGLSVFGDTDLDELPQIVVKGFFVGLIANVVALFPFGMLIAAVIWTAGLYWIFYVEWCDVWIIRILIGMNWFLNLIAQLIVVSTLASIFPIPLHDDEIVDNRPAGPNKVWDAEVIRKRGGKVGFANDDDEAVIGISLANCRIRDADLARMQDFPWLRRLRLQNTPITDVGLVHLHDCRKLEELNLTGTRVTEAGLGDLRKALPKTLILR